MMAQYMAPAPAAAPSTTTTRTTTATMDTNSGKGRHRQQRHTSLGTVTYDDTNASVGELDALDDFASIDSESQSHTVTSPGTSSHYQQESFYNPVGITIGSNSSAPSSPATGSQRSSFFGVPSPRQQNQDQHQQQQQQLLYHHRQQQSHSVNAVHMHVQENAKIPTFNYSVDRSNSSFRPPYYAANASTLRDIDEMVQLEENDRKNYIVNGGNRNHTSKTIPTSTTSSSSTNNNRGSMAELFLSKESSSRRSLDLNFQSLGALLADVDLDESRSRRPSVDDSVSSNNSLRIRNMNNSNNNRTTTTTTPTTAALSATQMDIDALTAAIDPTPLSEIRRKEEQRRQFHASSRDHPHHFMYYPYGRHHQLPIPRKPSPPLSSAPAPATAESTESNHAPSPVSSAVNANTNSTTNPSTIAPSLSTTNGTGNSMAQAVATAAALASTGFSTNSTEPNASGSPSIVGTGAPGTKSSTYGTINHHHHQQQQRATVPSTTSPYAEAQQQQSTKSSTTTPSTSSSSSSSTNVSSIPQNNKHSSTASRHYQRHVGPSFAPAQHAVAHSASRASMTAAASQKSRYGFGGNHTVPSVPSPPPSLGKSISQGTNKINTDGMKSTRSVSAGSVISTDARRSTSLSPSILQQSRTHPTYPPQPSSASSISSMNPLSAAHHQNSGAAYERKKQRAKDARIKLNESIERLAIAMSLAGSQSKQRGIHLDGMSVNFEGNNEQQDQRLRTLSTIEECTKLAESAKKWDRPSFVGTAASLIQALNAQCENLFRELAREHEFHESIGQDPRPVNPQHSQDPQGGADGMTPSTDVVNNGHGQDCSNDNFDNNSETSSNVGLKRHDAPESSANDGSGENLYHASKRIRSDDSDNGDGRSSTSSGSDNGKDEDNLNMSNQNFIDIPNDFGTWAKHDDLKNQSTDIVMTEKKGRKVSLESKSKIALSRVAKMLDPASLCRSQCVCREWKTMDAFDNDETWFDLSVKRFGFMNVRQWSEKLQDYGNNGDDDHGDQSTVPKKLLYQKMDDANVIPYLKQDSVTFLGDAKIPGRVGCWVFLVERSNGETLRSVRNEASVPDLKNGRSSTTSGAYVSLPVVELRFLIQNIGLTTSPLIVKSQTVTVDISTRRTGGELKEIYWDDRFAKVVKNLDGSIHQNHRKKRSSNTVFHHSPPLCSLDLFDSVTVGVHIHARGCSTISKFRQRSNFTKLLLSLDGTTVPLVIPFLRDGQQ